MKNYLIRSLYKIKSPMWFADRSNEGDLYQYYYDMHKLSLASFEKHLQGEWEFVFYEKEVDHIQDVFKDHFFEIYKFWKENAPCNILYCGPDTLMMKPTEVFDKYKNFTMFNYTDPRTTSPANREAINHYDIYHQHYFNADVRYYPAGMRQDIWNLGLKMAEDWDFNCWGTEQVILNEMLWKQPDVSFSNVYNPNMNYMGHNLFLDNWDRTKEFSNNWNRSLLSDANIVHLCGSRLANKKLELMIAMAKLT